VYSIWLSASKHRLLARSFASSFLVIAPPDSSDSSSYKQNGPLGYAVLCFSSYRGKLRYNNRQYVSKVSCMHSYFNTKSSLPISKPKLHWLVRTSSYHQNGLLKKMPTLRVPKILTDQTFQMLTLQL
jgi:hypothetical protein